MQDRELATKVRTKALNDIYAVLDGDEDVETWSDLKKQVVLKLAGTVLPRLNEHSGPDGGEIPLPIYGSRSVHSNNSDGKTIQLEEETS